MIFDFIMSKKKKKKKKFFMLDEEGDVQIEEIQFLEIKEVELELIEEKDVDVDEEDSRKKGEQLWRLQLLWKFQLFRWIGRFGVVRRGIEGWMGQGSG